MEGSTMFQMISESFTTAPEHGTFTPSYRRFNFICPPKFVTWKVQHVARFCRCAQAGVLDRNNMDKSADAGAKHVKKLTVLLNRLLGMNLQQQQIVFGCEFPTSCQRSVLGKVLKMCTWIRKQTLLLTLAAGDTCRYLQQLIDHETEKSKQDGSFDKGVTFLKDNVKEIDRAIVWRNPKAAGGQV
jgi:hypothetical protein